MAQHAQGERVDERVVLVGGVEYEFAADVGDTQGVAVVRQPGNRALKNSGGIGMVDGADAQLVHDGNGARAHRDDVAHDAANTGSGALERDRKSTRLNSSHVAISYAVFCLKKKKH